MKLESELADFPSEDELMNMIMHTSSTVWDNELLKPDIERWLKNFTGEVFEQKYERLLALWLLSHFTFYNQEEVTHLCKVVYQDLIHKIVKNDPEELSIPTEVINDFLEKTNIIPAERMSGSGGFISYFFRTVNNLPINIFNFSIANVGNTVENVVIIDDVTLTAGRDGQLYKFFNRNVRRYSSKKFYLLTLIASASSTEYLMNKFDIEVVSAIRLDSRDKCFDSESDVFSAFPNLIENGLKFAEHYGKKIGIVDPLGYKNGQYTFGFFYNTPDNTLPIFWGQVNGWVPIIKRYHKNYTGRKFLGNERFI